MEFFPFFRRPYYYYGGMQKQEAYHRIKQESEKEKKPDTRSTKEEPIFEIFGIKLCFDDILIIALIFFLYNEGVRDNLLFIALILLLLS